MVSKLDTEIAAFHEMEDALKKKYAATEWVVFAQGRLQAHFDGFAAAAVYVAEHHGNRPALIRQIEERPVHMPFLLMRA